MTKQSLQLILTIIGVLGTAGLFAGGIGYLIGQFKKGNKQEKNDVVSSADQLSNFWKEQVEGFREVIKELTAKIEKQKDDHTIEMKKVLTELGEVRGQLGAESKQKAEYLAILQNRDPETQEFMKYMFKEFENQGDVNKELIRVLGEIHSMAKDEHDRDFKVTSIVSKSDNPHTVQ